MKSIILILSILHLSKTACIPGCLKCSAYKNCLLCDTNKFYALKNSTCSLKNIENCEKINQIGECLVCLKNFYLDSTTKKCVGVETEKKIFKCLNYSNTQICQNCENDYIIENSKCVKIENLVTNCEIYKNDGICSLCMNGFYLTTDGKKCEAFPEISNCNYFHNFTCLKCDSNYVLNNNMYFYKTFQSSSEDEKKKVLGIMDNEENSRKILEAHDVCQRTIVKNCLEYDTFKTCKICLPKHFLTKHKTCEAYPFNAISNCLTYSNLTTCTNCLTNFYLTNSECKSVTAVNNCFEYSKTNDQCIKCNQNFFLASTSECKSIVKIDDCSIYSQISNSSQCVKCTPSFYLSSPSSCVVRVNSKSIKNCKTKILNSDKCEICNTNFILSTDGELCSEKVSNCDTHYFFTKTNTPTCSKCEDLYYLANSICNKGSVTNCQKFKISEDKCEICKEKFYLNSQTNTCEEQQKIINCSSYSKTNQNTCEVCEAPTFNFKIKKWCMLLPEIPNCKTYNHNNIDYALKKASCSLCEDGFYLKSSTLCQQISIYNCKTVSSTNSNLCTHCKESFVFFLNGSVKECVAPHDFMVEQCDKFSHTGDIKMLKNARCDECKINSIPIDYKNTYACISNLFLKDGNTIDLIDSNLITDCVKYDTKTTCSKCGVGKFLSFDRLSCVSNCGTDIGYDLIKYGIDGSSVFVQYSNYCKQSQNKNDLLYGPEKNDTGSICLKCKEGNINVVTGVITTSVKSSNINLSPTYGNWIEDIAATNLQITCPDNTTKINEVTGTTLIKNCQYYKLINGTTEYGCLKCKHGFQGKSNTLGKYLVNCDNNIGSCQTSIIYHNIPATFSQFFSCHKCQQSDQIPFLIYLSQSTSNIEFSSFKQFTLDVQTTFSTENKHHPIECLNNSSDANFKTSIGAENNSNTGFIKANCGLGLLSLNENTKASITSAHVHCAACKPGYNGTISTTAATLYTVTNCVAIENCSENSTWFNACSSCKSGYIYKVAGSDDILYSECIQHSDLNCFASKDSNLNCEFCKKGFSKNLDGVCEIMNIPKCEVGEFVPFLKIGDGNKNNLGYMLWYGEEGVGCNRCVGGYTAFKQNDDLFEMFSCAYSIYVDTNKNNYPNQKENNKKSNFVSHCESYFVHTADLVCAKCVAGFVIRSDGSECITLENCVYANNSGNSCKQCSLGYSLVSNICVIGNIANCATYDRSNSQVKVTCKTCNPGFYLSSTNLCVAGEVTNCLAYKSNSAKECLICQEGYFKIAKNLLKNSRDYCYKFIESHNCNYTTITNLTLGAEFKCEQCNKPHSVYITPDNTSIQTTCFPYNLIKNCEIYNTIGSLSETDFMCKKCFNGFYLSDENFKCTFRKNTNIYCDEFEIDKDLCKKCKDKFFLSDDKTTCVSFPEGIFGCVEFIDKVTCTKCGENSFLKDNKCFFIENEKKIQNCLSYENEITCKECNSNFFLEGNLCVQLNVSNCLKVTNKDTCESCLPGHRIVTLVTENGKTNCQSFTKPNCHNFDQTAEKNNCLLCYKNFYIDGEGNCKGVETTIQNCLVNPTKDTCSKCDKNYILTKNKKSCITSSQLDKNCLEATETEKMSCSRCNGGYYFRDGICFAFKKKSFVDGCFIQDYFDDKHCLVCRSGYYMDVNFNCVKNGSDKDLVVNENKNDESNIGINNFFVLGWFAKILLF